MTVRILATLAALTGSLLALPALPADASSGCGSGWYRQSQGYFTKQSGWSGPNYRHAQIWHTGIAQYCTQNDMFNDDENRRVLIGYPADVYALDSQVDRQGRFSRFCVTQTVKAYLSGVLTSESWTIGGTVSKESPAIDVSYSPTYDRLTVRVARQTTCSTTATRLHVQTSGITLTGTNESAEVEWVEMTTKVSMTYWINGTKYVRNHSLVERDYS